MQKLNIFFIAILVLLNFQSILGKFSVRTHKNLKGTDPVSGLTVEYGCYQGKCWAYCNGLGKMWCWTNKKSTDTTRACRNDYCCTGYYYKCVSQCG